LTTGKIKAKEMTWKMPFTHVTIDLKTETIRKGSPHTLRITKTQAAYNREMKSWNEDLELLNKIEIT